MKILSNLLILLISLTLVVGGAIYAARTGNLNKQIKYALEYYLQLQKLNGKISHLSVKNDQITIDSIVVQKDEAKFRLDNIVINYKLDLNYRKSNITADIKVHKIIGQRFDEEFFGSEIKISYTNHFLTKKSQIQLGLDNISYKDFISSTIFKDGTAYIDASFSKKTSKYYIKAALAEDVNFNLQGVISDYITLGGSIKNMPVTIYKPVYYLYPNHRLLIFCNDFIKEGIIESGELTINMTAKDVEDNNYTQENISGFAKINNLKFLYNALLPPLTHMQIDVVQKGLISKFIINKANSTDIIIGDGLIDMDWKGQENTKLFVTAKAQGPTKALTDFIAMDVHDILRQSSIDLTKFTGNANIDIKIEIPLKAGTKDIYDITAHMPNTGLSIFNNKIVLNGGEISGKYNGENVKIDGKGKINDFDSEISFVHNLTDQKDFNQKLNITTNLRVNSYTKKPKRLGFLTLLDGGSRLDFEYLNINKKGQNVGMISAKSDLKRLDLYFDKLGIHKKQGEKADFILNGVLESPTQGNLDFNISGSNNLKIKGSADINPNINKIILDNINHNQTTLFSKILVKKDLIDINIQGKVLDLSDANMFQFLEKERDSGSTKMQIDVDKIKLKNDIWLDAFKLNFACNSTKCYLGHITADIGSRNLELKLLEDSEQETWVLTSSNAGALLKGIGAYKNMRAGNLSLILKTSRKDIKTGEIIPIINGTFEFERFVLQDVPLLSRIVSFVSLPGFLNTISGRKNIIFSSMKGKFSFQDEVLNVSASQATGPFFDFTLKGSIDTAKRTIDLKGLVTPALYGLSSVIGSVPIIGKFFSGNKEHRGIISTPYKIKDSY